MKKGLAIFFVVLLIPMLSAAAIDTKLEYKKGETIIAKISGNFIDTIGTNNVVFYRGHVEIPMDYEIGKLGDYYYLKASLTGKEPNNYSVSIEGVNYYVGGQVSSDPITRNFTISSEQASFSVDPGFIVSETEFFIEIKSFIDSDVSVDINSPKGITAVNSIVISAQKAETVYFNFSNFTEDFFSTIAISGSSTSYEIPVYLFGKSSGAVCGDKILGQGELCDMDNFGDINGCSDFGFSSGTLSCNSPGSYYECRFNTSLCFNASSEEPVCGNEIIEAGEQCDEDSWGKIKSCTQFGFDAGKLSCVDCSFDTSLCYDYSECERDRDCDDNEECVDNQCKKINPECDVDKDCDEHQECIREECVNIKKECVTDDYCRIGYECNEDGFCFLKEKECDINSDCKTEEQCINHSCVDLIAEKTCSDSGGKFCGTDESCDADSKEIRGKDCCLGNCMQKEKSSTGKIIGWSFIAIIILGLVFFYFKYKNTNRKKPDLLEIGKSPVVKGNLFR